MGSIIGAKRIFVKNKGKPVVFYSRNRFSNIDRSVGISR